MDDLQHEMEAMDDDLFANEHKLNEMEQSIKSNELKCESLMKKLKNARSKKQQVKAQNVKIRQLQIEGGGTHKSRQKPVIKLKSTIDAKEHSYLYDEFESEDRNQCYSGLWTVFSQIGCNGKS